MSLRKWGMVRSILRYVGFVILGIALGAGGSIGYHYLREANKEEIVPIARRQVLTVNRPVELGEILEADDLIEIEVEETMIPAGAFVLPEEVIGQKAWVELKPQMLLQPELFYRQSLEYWENIQELELKELPAELLPGDFVDLRILFPSGHDYCVLSHKQVGALDSEKKKIVIGLKEEERVRLGSAQTDVRAYEHVYFYLTIYPKAVDMPDTIVRYPVSGSVQPLYEDVTQSGIVSQERIQLESALAQLKEEEKFLRLQERAETEQKAEAAAGLDKNLQSFVGEKAKEVQQSAPEQERREEAQTSETEMPAVVEAGKETNPVGADSTQTESKESSF